ncbi:MAG: DciA family protein [Betaproteobacteria bacterium]
MRPLRQIIRGESSMAELLNRRQKELAVEQHVKRALPRSLAACVSVADARSSELALSATSGAAAALLRQRSPQLQQALAAEGCEFTGIRVRVQARGVAVSADNRVKKQLDVTVSATLVAAAARLGDSPLAHALLRLAGRAGPAGSQRDERPAQCVEHEDAEQQHQRELDHLADEAQVAPVALDDVERQRADDRRKRSVEKDSDDDHG